MKRVLQFLLIVFFISGIVGSVHADYQGTIGTQFTIVGSGFGHSRSTVYLMNGGQKVQAKVAQWSDSSIICQWIKTLSPGSYPVFVQPKGKGISPIAAGHFTIMQPSIGQITPNDGAAGGVITLNGWYFSNKKPKVYFENPDTQERKTCRVLSSSMNPETGMSTLQFVIPKWGLPHYNLILINAIGQTVEEFPVTYSISGRVTYNGNGLSGVSITLIGTASANITTDANGNYTFTSLQNGLYTLTPSKEGYTFSPSTYSATMNSANVTGQDFTALLEIPTPAINLPRTGQITSYAAGDDGDIRAGVPWPGLRFTANGDCVTDNLTGLMWAKSVTLGGQKTWQQALDYVASINGGAGLCGYSDWRMPNVNELESLVNAEQPDTAAWLNGEGFTIEQLDNCYWSSTTAVRDLTGYAWYVCSRGDSISVDKSSTISVLPVRNAQTGETVSLPQTGQKTIYAGGDDGDLEKGVAWPDPRFIESGDCVTDNLTGLMWPKNANLSNGPKTWQEALDYGASINSGTGLCGYHDWRLPNRKELRSLIDYSKSFPSLPEGHPFTGVQSGSYWSSTTFADNTGTAWGVNVWYGSINYPNKSDVVNVWLVRGDTSLYVDAVNGNNLGPGTSDAPFKTITHALSVAGLNKTIRVSPGTYDAALGEVFPLVLQSGQILIGDEANKGEGATPTLIVGTGAITGVFWVSSATIVGAEGSRISGFRVGEDAYTVGHMAVVADGITMQITNNTFKALTYGGIALANSGTSVIENNVFDTGSYGVYVWYCPDGPTIKNNTFLAMSIPIDIAGNNTYAVISNNTMTGNGQIGIQVQGGHSLIENNTFNRSTGYTFGAIKAWSSTAIPKIRGNVFDCATAISVDEGNPDLGTVTDHGNNDFGAVTGASLTHNGAATVYAIGNKWASTTPLCGTDVIVSAGGVVIWGEGTGEQCP